MLDAAAEPEIESTVEMGSEWEIAVADVIVGSLKEELIASSEEDEEEAFVEAIKLDSVYAWRSNGSEEKRRERNAWEWIS